MPAQEEKCFPRGGKEPHERKSKKFSITSERQSLNSSRVVIPKRHIKTPKKTSVSVQGSVKNLSFMKSPVSLKRKSGSVSALHVATPKQRKVSTQTSVKNLSLTTLSEGNIILGYVREVSTVQLKVNLPGVIVGYVPAANISEEYSTYLKEIFSGRGEELQELTDMFKPGQLVVTRVEEISFVKEKAKVTLSLIPGRINKFVSVSAITKGLFLSASVQSNESHVYVMNCGINGVRAVLKKDQALNYERVWNNGKPLGVGQVLRCLVTKCTTSEVSANVELTVDPKKLSECFVEKNHIPLNFGVLGKCFQLSVEKVFPTGLLVKFSPHQYGYVHSNHLNVDFSEIKEKSLIPGRVLYIDLLKGDIFFSGLKTVCGPHPPPSPFQEFKKGCRILQAKVVTRKGGNLLLEFGENSYYYGLVSMHHLDIAEEIEKNGSFLDLVDEKYPPGSFHECKVLEYDYVTQKYICTFRRSIIKQKFTSLDELYPGLVTKCIVENSSSKRITLNLCGIQGIVEPIQYSDVPVSDPCTLFSKGQKVKAKVLALKNPICEFTLKPSLVNSSNPVLTKFSDAKYDVQYEGVIVLVTDKGVLVKFFADFTTFVSANHVLGSREWDLNKLYYVGQVVKCQVSKICEEEQKLILSVQPLKTEQSEEQNSPIFPLKIGESYTVIVKEITQHELIVQEEGKGVKGKIPVTQLTDSPQISQLLSNTYKKGDKLQALCLNGGDEIIFTVSPTFRKYFESAAGKKLSKIGLSGLQEGHVVPSMVAEVFPNSLILSLPMFRKTCSVSVSSKHICNGIVKDIQSLGLLKNQTLMVCILSIFDGSICEGACNLSLVFDKSKMSENGLLLLQDFMISQNRIKNVWRNNGHPLGELNIGSQVEGTVITVTALGAVINLDNGARAVVMPKHLGLNLKVNAHVKGTVMYLDTVNQCVEITLWKHVHDKFSLTGKNPQILEGKHKKGIVYISRPDVLICGFKHFTSSYIAYVPSRWHINDLRPSAFSEVEMQEPVTIRECKDDMLFAVPRKVELEERKCKSNVSDADSAEEDSEERERVQRESLDENKMSEECVDFISLKTDTCSESIQSSMKGTLINIKHVKKSKQQDNHSFDEPWNLQESADLLQCEKTFSESQVDKNEKDKQKKKKSKSLVKSVNEIEMIEGNTISLSNENLSDDGINQSDQIKGKKQKIKPEMDKSLSVNESRHSSQLIEGNVDCVDIIENHKQKRNKRMKNNNSSKSVNHCEAEESILESEENDVSKIKGTCDQSNEHLTMKNKNKIQKKKYEIDKSLNLSGSHDSSQFVKESVKCVDAVENQKQKKKKKIKNNNSLDIVDHCETQGSVLKIEENVLSKVEETCQSNEQLIVESKKQKKKVASNTLSDLSWQVEENCHECFINNENKVLKTKRKNSLEKSEEEINLVDEGIVPLNRKKESEEIGNNLQTLKVNETIESKNKKQKREAGVNHLLTADESTDLSFLIEENLSESVMDNNVSELDIKKKKRKTVNSLLNHQNEVENSLGSKTYLTTRKKNGEEKESFSLHNKGNEENEKKGTSSNKKYEEKQPLFLNVCAGFFWNATPDQLPAVNKLKNANADSSSEDETEIIMNKKKKQRLTVAEKRELARQEEERLRKVEERLMDAERNPVSSDDFDRLVMSAPNDSQHWIKYMAYHLEATEVGKARAVAERALKTISFREEQEKLNVWVALLNLENLYGTQESLDKTLEEAVKMNDSYKIHMQVLNMFSVTKKLEELDKMVQLVTKKYKSEINTWIEAGLACMKCGEIEKSRQVMQRALKILDKKSHVEVVTRFARMENEWGESERAETLMENILTSYPKRIDVWSVYIDMLIKSKKFDIARQVLDRAVIQKLPVSKMKFLFKKYLAFEQAHGTPDRVEKIREMAKDFVENLKSDIS